VGVNLEEIDAREINSVPVFDDVVVRVGRYGPYLERVRDGASQRANLPDDLPPDELSPEVAEQLFSVPQEGRSLGVDPVTGHEIVAKEGRYGPYVTEILPESEAPAESNGNGTKKKAAAKPKPRTGSLFKSMSTETVTLEDALRLLSLPRLVGTDPESGEEITAQNGRYGPYLKKGTDSRSLGDEEQLFSVTLEDALEIYKQPKQRGRRTAAATPPLRELGKDAATGKPMVIKDGRFGPYVTDGETNASLRKGDDIEKITDERASELLAERRAKVGTTPKKAPARRKAAPRKTKAETPS
jgi:DNA topoisomerase-1